MLQNPKDIDKDEFFREVTVRICSSLDIEKALERCFLFLKDIISLDEILLVTYNSQLGTINIEAVANYGGRSCKDIKIPLPARLQDEIEMASDLSRIRYIKDTSKDLFIAPIGDILGWRDSQAIVTRFIL